jgi:hypothetical protein
VTTTVPRRHFFYSTRLPEIGSSIGAKGSGFGTPKVPLGTPKAPLGTPAKAKIPTSDEGVNIVHQGVNPIKLFT